MPAIILLVSDTTTRHYSLPRSHGSPKIKITGKTPPATCDTDRSW